jgi:hypothetical protein
MRRTPGKVHSGHFGHPGRQRSGVFYPGITKITRPEHLRYCAGILEHSMGARFVVPALQATKAANRFLGIDSWAS